MRILVFQHVDCEHPGSLRQFLAEDEIEWDPVYLHRGDKIPSFDKYDALWVMGGQWMYGTLKKIRGSLKKRQQLGIGFLS